MCQFIEANFYNFLLLQQGWRDTLQVGAGFGTELYPPSAYLSWQIDDCGGDWQRKRSMHCQILLTLVSSSELRLSLLHLHAKQFEGNWPCWESAEFDHMFVSLIFLVIFRSRWAHSDTGVVWNEVGMHQRFSFLFLPLQHRQISEAILNPEFKWV